MMTNSNEDGVDKVLASRGTYFYIMESGSIDYQVQYNFQYFVEKSNPCQINKNIQDVGIAPQNLCKN